MASRRWFRKTKAPKSTVHMLEMGVESAFFAKHIAWDTRWWFQKKNKKIKNKPERELVTLGWDLDRAALGNYTTIKCIKFYNQQFQIVHSKLIYSTQIKGSDFGLWNQPPAFCLPYNAIWLPKKRGAFFPSCTCLASRMPAAHLRQTAMLALWSPDNTREKQGEGEGRTGCWWAPGQERL